MEGLRFKGKKIGLFGIAVSFFLFGTLVGNAFAQQKPIVIKFFF